MGSANKGGPMQTRGRTMYLAEEATVLFRLNPLPRGQVEHRRGGRPSMAQGLSERNNFRLSSFGGGNRGLRRSWIACAGRSGSDAILGWLIRRRHGAPSRYR